MTALRKLVSLFGIANALQVESEKSDRAFLAMGGGMRGKASRGMEDAGRFPGSWSPPCGRVCQWAKEEAKKADEWAKEQKKKADAAAKKIREDLARAAAEVARKAAEAKAKVDAAIKAEAQRVKAAVEAAKAETARKIKEAAEKVKAAADAAAQAVKESDLAKAASAAANKVQDHIQEGLDHAKAHVDHIKDKAEELHGRVEDFVDCFKNPEGCRNQAVASVVTSQPNNSENNAAPLSKQEEEQEKQALMSAGLSAMNATVQDIAAEEKEIEAENAELHAELEEVSKQPENANADDGIVEDPTVPNEVTAVEQQNAEFVVETDHNIPAGVSKSLKRPMAMSDKWICKMHEIVECLHMHLEGSYQQAPFRAVASAEKVRAIGGNCEEIEGYVKPTKQSCKNVKTSMSENNPLIEEYTTCSTTVNVPGIGPMCWFEGLDIDIENMTKNDSADEEAQ